jgi:flagellar operon protein
MNRQVTAMVIDSMGNSINRPVVTGKPQISGPRPAGGLNGKQGTAAVGFESILQRQQTGIEEIKFSKHAEYRLRSRNINLTQAQKQKMKEAVAKAESKGVRDSLVLMDDLAFVVNIRNRMVITAANSSELKENVFTNIDGAVIV